MEAAKKIEEKAKDAMSTVGKIYDRLPTIEDLMKLLENKETEIRLKFDGLTLNGDVALSLTLIKEEKGKK